MLGPDAVPEARARADIAIILVPNASWLRSATNWPAKPASPAQRRGEGGLLAQHLDDASAAVDPDPVAAVEAHGGVAAPDHGRDAELAGHDRGMGQRRADVGDDGRGAGEDQRPADVGDGGDQDLAVTELSGLLGRA